MRQCLHAGDDLLEVTATVGVDQEEEDCATDSTRGAGQEPPKLHRCREPSHLLIVPFVRPPEMLAGDPLPGWHGRFFHSANMTFAHYDIEAGAAPLHEHQHEQEEVWHVVEGEIALSIAGEEQVLSAECVAVVPPHTSHGVRPLTACRAIIADFPLRPNLPGLSNSQLAH